MQQSSALYDSASSKIFKELLNSKIKDLTGSIVIELDGVSTEEVAKDIMGGVIQEWFYAWVKSKKFAISKNPNSQMPPDFFLDEGVHLELKTFDSSANPNFDIANFDAFIRNLTLHPERLDVDHLVFSYELIGTKWFIREIWIKKMWELTGPTPSYALALQVKQNRIHNIRPKRFNVLPHTEFFANRLDFVKAISIEMNNKNQIPNGFADSGEWFSAVKQQYQKVTGRKL